MKFYVRNALYGALMLLLASSCTQTNSAADSTAEASSSSDSTDAATEIANADPAQTLAAVLEEIRDRAEELQLCEGETNQETWTRSQIYSTGQGAYIAEILCFMAAYQGSYEYWLYEPADAGAKIEPLTLTSFQETESGELVQWEAPGVGGLPEYDPKQQTLTVFSKARGLGDCGTLAQYQFADNAFQLMEYRAKLECDGNYIEPEDYPLIYPNE